MDNNNIIEPARFTQADIIIPAEFKPTPAGDHKTARRRTGAVLVAAVIAVCVGVILFLFTAKSVYIDIEPAGAAVDIDGGLHLKFGERYLMNSNTYRILITYPRYYPVEQELVIGAEQNQRYSFQLQRLPGHVQIHTLPVNDAEVWVNNEFRGKAPLTVRNLSHGTHVLELVAERYLPYTSTIEVEGLDKMQELEVELTPAWGVVSLSSQPAGADVFIDDVNIGNTPLTSELLQGDHNIIVRLSGYKGWSETISVTANEAMTIPEITLEAADAVVFLESVPSRANVTVDGKYAGQTPVEVALSPGETVEIRFFKEGYQRALRTLAVKPDDKQRVLVNLQPELASIQFNSNPADAELYIDGIFRGRASQTLELTTQAHAIEIKKPGYVDYQTTIIPRVGVDQQVTVSLKTLAQAKQEAIKPVITTAAGQKMKLFYPSGFTMGASRREAGRRANETLRNVILDRPFYLSLHEITNGEYRAFDRNHNSGEVQGNSLNGERQPVVNITWEQAAAYCNWLSRQDKLPGFYMITNGKVTGFNRNAAGYRLPTEAEWEWTARVVGRQQVLKFPWGDDLPPAKGSGNYGDDSAAHLLGRIAAGYNDGYAVTAPVGSFSANSKGIYDLGGNVSEWVHDYYDISITADTDAELNPMGPERGNHHVVRGSSWAHGTVTELRLSYRDYGDKARDDIGFRIARFLDN